MYSSFAMVSNLVFSIFWTRRKNW